MSENKKNKLPWYACGLHFECTGCGKCCSGPDEGYIWVTAPEIEMIAEKLKMTSQEIEFAFLLKIGSRKTIREARPSNDCIFLQKVNGEKRCRIYDVRPNQCRTWPFWNSNLDIPDDWNEAAKKCAGINRGKRHSFEEIEKQRTQQRWW